MNNFGLTVHPPPTTPQRNDKSQHMIVNCMSWDAITIVTVRFGRSSHVPVHSFTLMDIARRTIFIICVYPAMASAHFPSPAVVEESNRGWEGECVDGWWWCVNGGGIGGAEAPARRADARMLWRRLSHSASTSSGDGSSTDMPPALSRVKRPKDPWISGATSSTCASRVSYSRRVERQSGLRAEIADGLAVEIKRV